MSGAGSERRSSPIRALLPGLAITVALLLFGGALAWRSYSESRRFFSTDLRLRTLIGEILRLDEVLTMAARMAAATGDPFWEKRYADNAPLVEPYAAEAVLLGDGAYAGLMAAAEKASEGLEALEHRALELVRDGRHVEAAALLGSAEYETDKKHYYAVVTGWDAVPASPSSCRWRRSARPARTR